MSTSKIFRLIAPDPAALLGNITTFLLTANPDFGQDMPTWSDGSVRLMPEGQSYDEPWFSEIIQVPAARLGVQGLGRCRLDCAYRPASQTLLYDSDGAPVIVDDEPVLRDVPRQIDMICHVEHDPALTIDALNAVFTTFIELHPLVAYTVPADLVAHGAPASLSLRTDAAGNRLVEPLNPQHRY